MKYSIIILCFAFLGCCHESEYTITVFNNSEKDLYCRTYLNLNNEASFNYYLRKNHLTDVGIGFGKEDSEALDKNPSEKIISVVYFDSIEEINPEVSYSQIKLKNIIVKKYSKRDLEKLNWQIVYK